jgi:hypothetical protein
MALRIADERNVWQLRHVGRNPPRRRDDVIRNAPKLRRY